MWCICRNSHGGHVWAQRRFLKIAGIVLIEPKPHYCFQKCNCINQSRIKLLTVSQEEKSASTVFIGKSLFAIGTWEVTWKVITGQTENSNRNYERILFLISNIIQNRSWLTKQWHCKSVIANSRIKFYYFSQKHVTLWTTTLLTVR